MTRRASAWRGRGPGALVRMSMAMCAIMLTAACGHDRSPDPRGGEGWNARGAVLATNEPCSSDDDCGPDVCAAVAPKGRVCAARCDDGACPEGFQCAVTDVAALCVQDHVMNCQPCQVDSDCNQAGLAGYACLAYGAVGSFCASPCGERPCPEGYACTEGRCRSRTGVCACNDVGVALGAETTCELVAAAGTCVGMRGCGASGLSPCIGATPIAERCDGRDNDCDGATDEGLDCRASIVGRSAPGGPGVSRAAAGAGASARLTP